MRAWLTFFRVVNLPTVPGDVFVGAALAQAVTHCNANPAILAAACAASVLLYMFGLADNDIVGADTDTDRPIQHGLISLRSARIARALCLLGTMSVSMAAGLPRTWWPLAWGLAVSIVIYNRTKWPMVMGLCRGMNLALGVAAVGGANGDWLCVRLPVQGCFVALVWVLYIGAVTKYSEGEETDPARKRRVGLLIGALVWLQLAAIIIIEAFNVGADLDAGGLFFIPLQLAMIALLFLFKRLMPKVSAS